MAGFNIFGYDLTSGGSVIDIVIKWVVNPLVWFLLLVFTISGLLFILYLRKKRRLIYPVVEIIDLGSGKTGFNYMKAGWFGRKSYLRGLIDYGQKVMKTNYNDEILDFSTEDYQEISGKRGVICYRNPTNQKILVPITRLKVINKELLAEIPPASYVDTVINIIKDIDKETRDISMTIAQYAIFGLVIVFALVSIIVIVNMVKQGQAEAKDLILNGASICTENARQAYQTLLTQLPSNAP
jgi:hypothetical protein